MAAMNQKPSEAGWFYHAPARSAPREPVGAPPPSQIPGLGEVEVLEREPVREMVFRDTDSKYIRMAKMGGRKDLLSIKANSSAKREPVGYPRSEWFYLEDNALQDQAEKEREQEQWQFLLPEYMVHQTHQAEPGPQGYDLDDPSLGSAPRRRAPYATQDQSSFYQDGTSLTDKTVRLPETRRPGYGVRSAKGQAGAAARKQPQQPMRGSLKPMSSQMQGEKPRLRNQSMPTEPEEPATMTKLLSNAYDAEWHDKVDKWHAKQKDTLDPKTRNSRPEPHVRSEYNNNYSKPASSTSNKPDSHRRSSGARKEVAVKEEEKPKEPFKLSKFKNVHSRVNSHQSPEILAAVSN